MNFIELRAWFSFLIEIAILVVIIMEYRYDAEKDAAKKQKRTRSTKKTTTQPSGVITTEESNEVLEPMEEKK